MKNARAGNSGSDSSPGGGSESSLDHRSSVIIISLDTAFRAFVPGATYFCDARLTSGRVVPDTKNKVYRPLGLNPFTFDISLHTEHHNAAAIYPQRSTYPTHNLTMKQGVSIVSNNHFSGALRFLD